jgi:hypothetical protein
MKWSDRRFFDGYFLDGKPDGEGDYTDENGRRGHALFTKGKFEKWI